MLASPSQPSKEQTMLDWLKSFIAPNTAPGALKNFDAYQAYMDSEINANRQPLPRDQWLQLQAPMDQSRGPMLNRGDY